MSSVDMTQLLNRLRTMQALAEGRSPEAQAPQQSVDFGALLKQTLDAVNDTQQTAGDLATRLETGDPQVSLEQVMIARQKASISFQAMMQTRNKLVTAYQEIMSMQF
jgi:flagellar hook-basal body complex protein FliE